MIKEIAVYVNDLGEAADFNEKGFIKVFAKNENKWSVVREFPFEFYSTEESKGVPLDTFKIVEMLRNCKVFVAKKFSNLAHMVLDSIGFSTWKMEGDPNVFLEYILEKEEEEAEIIKLIDNSNFSNKNQVISPVEISNNGYYILNLKELQDYNTGISSKQALKPFLNNVVFNELIVTCSHIPNWLEDELIKLKLNFQFSKTGQNDYIILITKNG